MFKARRATIDGDYALVTEGNVQKKKKKKAKEL